MKASIAASDKSPTTKTESPRIKAEGPKTKLETPVKGETVDVKQERSSNERETPNMKDEIAVAKAESTGVKTEAETPVVSIKRELSPSNTRVSRPNVKIESPIIKEETLQIEVPSARIKSEVPPSRPRQPMRVYTVSVEESEWGHVENEQINRTAGVFASLEDANRQAKWEAKSWGEGRDERVRRTQDYDHHGCLHIYPIDLDSRETDTVAISVEGQEICPPGSVDDVNLTDSESEEEDEE